MENPIWTGARSRLACARLLMMSLRQRSKPPSLPRRLCCHFRGGHPQIHPCVRAAEQEPVFMDAPSMAACS